MFKNKVCLLNCKNKSPLAYCQDNCILSNIYIQNVIGYKIHRVCLWFLYASKAFDRVNHLTLLKTCIWEKKCSRLYYQAVIVLIYSSDFLYYCKWGNTYQVVLISSGVRLIYLFNIFYMDDPSHSLIRCRIDCYTGMANQMW